MPDTRTETRRGMDVLVGAVSDASQVREASPVDTGAALVAQMSQRLAAVERRIQAQEAKR